MPTLVEINMINKHMGFKNEREYANGVLYQKIN